MLFGFQNRIVPEVLHPSFEGPRLERRLRPTRVSSNRNRMGDPARSEAGRAPIRAANYAALRRSGRQFLGQRQWGPPDTRECGTDVAYQDGGIAERGRR